MDTVEKLVKIVNKPEEMEKDRRKSQNERRIEGNEIKKMILSLCKPDDKDAKFQAAETDKDAYIKSGERTLKQNITSLLQYHTEFENEKEVKREKVLLDLRTKITELQAKVRDYESEPHFKIDEISERLVKNEVHIKADIGEIADAVIGLIQGCASSGLMIPSALKGAVMNMDWSSEDMKKETRKYDSRVFVFLKICRKRSSRSVGAKAFMAGKTNLEATLEGFIAKAQNAKAEEILKLKTSERLQIKMDSFNKTSLFEESQES